ncbi:MAG: DUF1254 domain-containing protein [Desulfobulbaceae bacterium]|nr:DUF1254 domain-containing protein [Desulfobulbaceae bacterium]
MIRRKSIAGVMILSALFLSSLTSEALAKESSNGVVITKDNFIHADSTRAYLKELDKTGKVNVIRPERALITADTQDVIRMNRDTLYTRIILDVKGGASITTKPYDGYQNINILDINHSQIASLNGSGTLKIDESMLTKGQHAYVIVRTGLLRKLSEKEMFAQAHKAQDNISIAVNSTEPFEPSVKYDFNTLDTVKYKILSDFALNPKPHVIQNGFGTMKDRDPEAARTVVAIGWGALSGENAVYAPFTGNKEKCSYTMRKPDLNYKEHGFFSFTIYNFDGYVATINYAINSDAMVANADGTYTVTFLASGEPVKEGEKNIVRTPRGKMWTGVLRNYYPNNNTDELFVLTDKHTAEVSKACMK